VEFDVKSIFRNGDSLILIHVLHKKPYKILFLYYIHDVSCVIHRTTHFMVLVPQIQNLIQLYLFFISTILLFMLDSFCFFWKEKKRVDLWLEVLQLVTSYSEMLRSL